MAKNDQNAISMHKLSKKFQIRIDQCETIPEYMFHFHSWPILGGLKQPKKAKIRLNVIFLHYTINNRSKFVEKNVLKKLRLQSYIAIFFVGASPGCTISTQVRYVNVGATPCVFDYCKYHENSYQDMTVIFKPT